MKKKKKNKLSKKRTLSKKTLSKFDLKDPIFTEKMYFVQWYGRATVVPAVDEEFVEEISAVGRENGISLPSGEGPVAPPLSKEFPLWVKGNTHTRWNTDFAEFASIWFMFPDDEAEAVSVVEWVANNPSAFESIIGRNVTGVYGKVLDHTAGPMEALEHVENRAVLRFIPSPMVQYLYFRGMEDTAYSRDLKLYSIEPREDSEGVPQNSEIKEYGTRKAYEDCSRWDKMLGCTPCGASKFRGCLATQYPSSFDFDKTLLARENKHFGYFNPKEWKSLVMNFKEIPKFGEYFSEHRLPLHVVGFQKVHDLSRKGNQGLHSMEIAEDTTKHPLMVHTGGFATHNADRVLSEARTIENAVESVKTYMTRQFFDKQMRRRIVTIRKQKNCYVCPMADECIGKERRNGYRSGYGYRLHSEYYVEYNEKRAKENGHIITPKEDRCHYTAKDWDNPQFVMDKLMGELHSPEMNKYMRNLQKMERPVDLYHLDWLLEARRQVYDLEAQWIVGSPRWSTRQGSLYADDIHLKARDLRKSSPNVSYQPFYFTVREAGRSIRQISKPRTRRENLNAISRDFFRDYPASQLFEPGFYFEKLKEMGIYVRTPLPEYNRAEYVSYFTEEAYDFYTRLFVYVNMRNGHIRYSRASGWEVTSGDFDSMQIHLRHPVYQHSSAVKNEDGLMKVPTDLYRLHITVDTVHKTTSSGFALANKYWSFKDMQSLLFYNPRFFAVGKKRRLKNKKK